jgi:hypothetical protein
MKVFLSSRADHAGLAADLARALDELGIQTAGSPQDVELGADLRERIEREAQSADAFVLLVNSFSRRDPQVRFEWRSALKSDWTGTKPLIPVWLDRSPLPGFLTNRKALDGSLPPEQIAQQVVRLLNKPADSIIPPTSEQLAARETRLRDLEQIAAALRAESFTQREHQR